MHTHYTLLHYHRYALDNALPLVGDNSVLGRSIVIHKANGDRWVCATILNNPTYTYLPPPPPPPSPPPSTETVVLTMTASGSISDYSDTSSLQQKVATAAGVDTSLVAISVAPGSVIITATIAVPASTSAATVQASLASTLGTAAAASAALGITVEADPTITVETSSSSSDSSAPIATIVGGVAAAVILCLLCLFLCCLHKRRQRQKNGAAHVALNNPNAGGATRHGKTVKNAKGDTAGYQMAVKDHKSLGANQA